MVFQILHMFWRDFLSNSYFVAIRFLFGGGFLPHPAIPLLFATDLGSIETVERMIQVLRYEVQYEIDAQPGCMLCSYDPNVELQK